MQANAFTGGRPPFGKVIGRGNRALSFGYLTYWNGSALVTLYLPSKTDGPGR
jgi:hypothetical protein